MSFLGSKINGSKDGDDDDIERINACQESRQLLKSTFEEYYGNVKDLSTTLILVLRRVGV